MEPDSAASTNIMTEVKRPKRRKLRREIETATDQEAAQETKEDIGVGSE